jgi:hypothetical protein
VKIVERTGRNEEGRRDFEFAEQRRRNGQIIQVSIVKRHRHGICWRAASLYGSDELLKWHRMAPVSEESQLLTEHIGRDAQSEWVEVRLGHSVV